MIAPVTWELLEPIEGTYDFGQLEAMVRTARKHQMKLILLWFGSWKNSLMKYTPAWVKADPSALRYIALSSHAKDMAENMYRAL